MIANGATIECADIDFNWIRVLQEMLNIKEAAALTHSPVVVSTIKIKVNCTTVGVNQMYVGSMSSSWRKRLAKKISEYFSLERIAFDADSETKAKQKWNNLEVKSLT